MDLVPAPSTSVSIISALELVSGAPIFVSHPTKLNDSVNNVDEQVSYGYTRAQAHAHTGTDSAQLALSSLSGTVTEGLLGSSIVSQGKLKTAQEECNSGVIPAGSSATATLSSVGEYGFWAEMKSSTYSGNCRPASTATGSYQRVIRFDNTGAGADTFYARIRYIQSSPPWSLHRIPWGHAPWVWLLRRISDGEVLRAACADDPCWWLRHRQTYPKGDMRALIDMPGIADLGVPERRGHPHPFADDFPILPSGAEVVLLDLRHLDDMAQHRPAARRLEILKADRQRLVALGVQEAELVEGERAAELASRLEASGFARAEQELDGLSEWRAVEMAQVARSSQLSEDRKDVLRNRIDTIFDLRSNDCRSRLPLRRRWHLMREAANESGQGFLEVVTKSPDAIGGIPERSVSDDREHPEFRHLPEIDGLFRRGRDGSPPKVRLMSP